MASLAIEKRAHPLSWIPSLYFAMGTPMVAVSAVAAIMYKNLGLSNAEIGLFTGSMSLPWALKPLWAPLIEMFRTKRFFVLAMEFLMALTLAAVGLALSLPSWKIATLVFLWITGFASATQDIAADGVYMTSTTAKEQAAYSGVQGICWNLGAILSQGWLVKLTQTLHDDAKMDWFHAWTVIMITLGAIMAVAGVWHLKFLPPGGRSVDAPKSVSQAVGTFLHAWVTFFQKKDIWMMVAVIFFYRFGEGLIEKIGPLFLLDGRDVGGLGLTNGRVADAYGIYGTIGFIAGAFCGGLFAAKLTLKRSFVLLALALNVPHVTYFYLSTVRPESFALVSVIVTIEKFGFGFGSVGHMLYMMQQLSPGPYRTAHYAFATAVMGLTRSATGMVSGYVQSWLGYRHFFLFVLAASLPPVLFAWRAPFHVKPDGADGSPAPAGH